MWEKSKRNREDWKYHRDELNVKLNWRHANFSQSEARFTRSDQLCLLNLKFYLKQIFQIILIVNKNIHYMLNVQQ
jgi:hypothetical protein